MTDHLQSYAGQNELLLSMFNSNRGTRKYNRHFSAFIQIYKSEALQKIMNFTFNITNALNSKTEKNAAENIVYVLSSGNDYNFKKQIELILAGHDMFLKL